MCFGPVVLRLRNCGPKSSRSDTGGLTYQEVCSFSLVVVLVLLLEGLVKVATEVIAQGPNYVLECF